MKLVINKVHGGFGLSDAGIRRYLELKGVQYWEVPGKWGKDFLLVPPEEVEPTPSPEKWAEMSQQERIDYNKKVARQIFYDHKIPRDDAVLIQVVEEMGEEADGQCASLQVVEIPDGVEWQIEEYDGREWVAEQHRTWQ